MRQSRKTLYSPKCLDDNWFLIAPHKKPLVSSANLPCQALMEVNYLPWKKKINWRPVAQIFRQKTSVKNCTEKRTLLHLHKGDKSSVLLYCATSENASCQYASENYHICQLILKWQTLPQQKAYIKQRLALHI